MSGSSWFEVDRAGMAAQLARRGKAWAVFEVLQNAFDAEPAAVRIALEPIAGRPEVRLVVEDNGEGWPDIEEAWRIFGRSRRAGEPTKRGRFSMGEKLVLALCREAEIISRWGGVRFNESGRRRLDAARFEGTRFEGVLRATRDELEQMREAVRAVIPPAGVRLSCEWPGAPGPIDWAARRLGSFEARLCEEGELRSSLRSGLVTVYRAMTTETPKALLDAVRYFSPSPWPRDWGGARSA